MGKAKPTGPHASEMTGPGAWPEVDEDAYSKRAQELGGVLSSVTAALDSWQSQQASIFNGPHVWSGDASKAASAAVDGATKTLQAHQQQLRDAIAWCNDAATHITSAKDTVASNVAVGQHEIQSIEKAAAKTNQNPDGAIRSVIQRKYGENVSTIDALAVGLGGKPSIPTSPRRDPGKPDPMQPGPEDGKATTDAPSDLTRPDWIVKPTDPVSVQTLPPQTPPGGSRPAWIEKPSDAVPVQAPPQAAAPQAVRPDPVVKGQAPVVQPAPAQPPTVASAPTGPAPAAPSLGGGSGGGSSSGAPGISSPSSPLSTTSGATGGAPVHAASAGQGGAQAPGVDTAKAGAGQPNTFQPQTAPVTNPPPPMAAQPSIPTPPPGPAPIPDAPMELVNMSTHIRSTDRPT